MSSSYTWETAGEQVAQDHSSSIANRIILVTGVSPGGLGAGFLSVIAKHSPRLLILATRNLSKAEETAKKIAEETPGVPIRLLELDLGSQSQIRKAAAEVNAYGENIDVLVNNAGIMAVPYATTAEGLESHFGICHIGHFLFTNLIMPKLGSGSRGARVVNVSSDGYRLSPIRFDQWNFEDGKTYNKWLAYGQAKTANTLFAVTLAEKLGKQGLVAVSLHPGVIFTTNLGGHVRDKDWEELGQITQHQGQRPAGDPSRYKSLSQGVATIVVAAFDPSISEHNGKYLSDCEVLPVDEVRCWGRDPVEGQRLWKLSEEIVGQEFEY